MTEKMKEINKERKSKLTITTHTDGDTLFEATILTTISVDAEDRTLLVLSTRPVLDFLLDATTEETLKSEDRKRREKKRREEREREDFSVYLSHKLNGRLHCQAEFK